MPLVRPRHRPRSVQPRGRRFAAAMVGLVTIGSGLVVAAAPAQAANVATPGNFTGYGFDQCLAPTGKVLSLIHI